MPQIPRYLLYLLPPGVLLLFSLYFSCYPNRPLPFTEGRIQNKRDAIQRITQKIDRSVQMNSQIKKELRPFHLLRSTAIQSPFSQAPAIFRERIEKAANVSNLKIRSMSDIRRTDIAEGLFSYELNFSADVQISELLQFMNFLYTETPRVYWKNFTIRPNNQLNVEYLVLNATLSVLYFLPDQEDTGGNS